MNDDDVEARLLSIAVQLAKPALSQTQGEILELLWRHGYLPAKSIVIEEGISPAQVERVLGQLKRQYDIVEPGDLVQLSDETRNKLSADFNAESEREPDTTPEMLAERHIKGIADFHVEMFSNEGKHPGRAHVRVRLPGGQHISVSLDDDPVVLTPNRGLRGEAAALKVIKSNLNLLRPIWRETRPDTQRLAAKS